MRSLILLLFTSTLFSANPVEARLFWQTYGSVVPAEGCSGGCQWNMNQDYFIPRYPSSCRYGLFSPCKTSRTTSPACRWCHPIYSGYCGIYGPCRYAWRNQVYRAHCGCTAVRPYRGPLRPCCGQACCASSGCSCSHGTECCSGQVCSDCLANVEVPGFVVLGSIPVEGGGLLGGLEMPTATNEGQPALITPATSPAVESLPSLGFSQTGSISQ